MAKVTVSFSGDTDLDRVLMDDKRILSDVGTTSREVTDGSEEHALTWFVRGQPGSTYTIKITEPDPAKFEHTATIDSSTKDAGLFWFRVQ